MIGLDLVVGLVATAVAVVLLFTFLTHATALWRDEVSSVNTQMSPTFAEMWRRAEFESFPLLWMLLLRGWIALGAGATDAGLRLFGSIGVVSLIAAIWFAARRLGRRAPVVSLALLAVNPEVVQWAATIRPWGLGSAIAVVTVPLVWEAYEKPARPRVILAGLAAILSVQCLFQNAVFLAAAIAGCLLAAIRARDVRRGVVPFGIGVVAALSLLPYLGIIRRRADWNQLGAGSITFSDLWQKLWDVTAAAGILSTVVWAALVVATLVLAGVAATSPVDRSEGGKGRALAIYAATGLVTALAGLLLFYRELGYPTQAWYYMGLLSIGAVCAEAVINVIAPMWIVRRALPLLAGLVLVAGFGPARSQLQTPLTNVDLIASRLAAEAVPGDLVLANPWYLGVTLTRYYRGGAEIATIPPISDHTISRYDLLKQQMLQPDAVSSLRVRVEQVLASGHRVWMVGDIEALPPGTPLPPLPPPPLPERGWNSVPYETLWMFQVGALLQDRAVHNRPIDIGSGGPLEDAQLHVFEGWRQ
jgi:hypothetical protein